MTERCYWSLRVVPARAPREISTPRWAESRHHKPLSLESSNSFDYRLTKKGVIFVHCGVIPTKCISGWLSYYVLYVKAFSVFLRYFSILNTKLITNVFNLPESPSLITKAATRED